MSTHPLVAQLTSLRKAAGINRAVISRLAGLNRGQVREWESGAWCPNLANLQAWARVLGSVVVVSPRDGVPVFGDPVEVLTGIRARRGLLQKQLVQAAGFTQAQVSLWEHRVHSPTVPLLTVWADVLDCDLVLVPAAVMAMAVAA